MFATNNANNVKLCEKLTVNSSDLPDLLGCGRTTAFEIGNQAGARVKVGRRVLWNVGKIKEYLDQQAEGD